MKREGRRPGFDAATIALAMELRCEGVEWKLIARHLGDGIKDAAHYAARAGISACAR